MNKYIKFLFFLLPAPLFFLSCAQIGSLTGGLKDSLAPEMIKSYPKRYATNYKGAKIIIGFNEFFQFEKIDEQFFISPPLKEKPEFLIKKKNAVIKLNNVLKDSTTYTLSFGNSIVDFNESNPLKNFRFVFSTGDIIDTLGVGGYIKDAYLDKVPKDVYVMLYNKYDQLSPKKRKPDYIARPDTSGYFFISNIRKYNYHIFALRDMNNNLIYDQANEAIAFLDVDFTPSAKTETIIDTLKKGLVFHNVSKKNALDTLKKDTLITSLRTIFYPNDLNLLFFQEDNAKQYIKQSIRDNKNKCTFVFNRPLTDSATVNLLNESLSNRYIRESNLKNDSIIYWLTDTVTCNKESLTWLVSYQGTDSVGNQVRLTDTVNLKFVFKPIDKINKRDKKSKNNYLKVSTNLRGNIDYFGELLFETDYPVSAFDLSKIQLTELKDTLITNTKKQEEKILKTTPIKIRLKRDVSNTRKFSFAYKWTEGAQYKLRLDSLAFIDIYGKTNDSVEFKFGVNGKDYYGGILLNMKNIGFIEQKRTKENENKKFPTLNEGEILIQILDQQNTVIVEKSCSKDSEFKITDIAPGTYKMLMIHDRNKNKKWDTGIYLQNLQPEKVLRFNSTITIRSNWDTEVEWNVMN